MQRPESKEEESPQSLLPRCWDTGVLTRATAAPARLSRPASCWRSAFVGTPSSCPQCNSCQLSGLDRRRRIPLRTEEVQLYPARRKNPTVDEEQSNSTWAPLCFPALLVMDESICSALVGPPVGESRPQLWVSRCTVWVIRQDHLLAWCPQTPQGWRWFLDKSTRLDGDKLSLFFPLSFSLNPVAKISANRTVCGQSLEPKSCFKKEMKSWWRVSLIPSKWLQARMTTSFGWVASQRAMLCIVSWRGETSVGKNASKKDPDVKLGANFKFLP